MFTLYASYMNVTLFTMFRIVNSMLFNFWTIKKKKEFANKEIEEIKCMQLLYTA